MAVDSTATQIAAVGPAPKRKKRGPIVGGQFRHEVNDDGTVTIFNVPIFAKTKRGDFDYDDSWIEESVANAHLEAKDGHLPPMHLGHFEEGKPKPPEVGAFRVRRRGVLGVGGESVPVIFADLIVTDQYAFEQIQAKRLRYRSVEANFKQKRIRSLALLDSEPPYHKLPMTTVSDETTLVPDGLDANEAASMVVGFSEANDVQVVALEFPNMPMTVEKVQSDRVTGLRYVTFSDGEVRAFTVDGLDDLRAREPELFAEDDKEPEEEEKNEESEDSEEEEKSSDEDTEDEEKHADEIKPGESAEGADDEESEAGDEQKSKAEMALGEGKSETIQAIEALIDTLGDEAALKAIQAVIETTKNDADGSQADPGNPQGAEVQGVPAIMGEGDPMESEKMSELLVENQKKTAELVKFKEGVERKESIRAAVASLTDRVTGEDIEAELTKFAEDYGVPAMEKHAETLKAALPAVNADDGMEKFEEGAPRNVPDEVAKYRTEGPDKFEAAQEANALFGDGSCTSLSRERFIEIEIDRKFGGKE